MTEDPRQAALDELLALLIQGRPEGITASLLAGGTPEMKNEAASIANAVSALAVGLSPAPPATGAAEGDALKARILASLAGRTQPRKAVLVIDMQNDNLTPGSSVEVPRARAIVPALQAHLDAAREAGVPVVYILDEHAPDDADLDVWTTHSVAGSAGAEVWPELRPKPGDSRVTKSTYSAFTGSRLEAVLDELAVDTLVLTGCLTEIGIAATAMDALQRGYAIQIPADAQAGSAELIEKATLATLSFLPPFEPARKKRLESIRTRLAAG